MKLQYDESLSNFAFNSNLRRFNKVVRYVIDCSTIADFVAPPAVGLTPAGPYRTHVETALEITNKRLKLEYDELLSSFAFNFDLCHYAVTVEVEARGGGVGSLAGAYTRPLFELNVSTFCGTLWVTSVCQWQKRLRLS